MLHLINYIYIYIYIHQGYTTHITWLQYGYCTTTLPPVGILSLSVVITVCQLQHGYYLRTRSTMYCYVQYGYVAYAHQQSVNIVISSQLGIQQGYIKLYTLYMFGCSRILLTMWVFVQQILQKTRCQSGLQFGDLVLPVVICYFAIVVHCTSKQCGKPNNKRTICGCFFTIRLWPSLKWLYSH